MESTWTLDEPVLPAVDLHRLCSSTAVQATRTLLAAADQHVINAAQRLRTAMLASDTAPLQPAAFKSGTCPDKHLKANYTQRMVPLESAGRPHYDNLKAAALGKMCPACGYRLVSTLDHYLPKGEFPLLATAPANLVPMCGDCNKTKLEFFPSHDEELLLHPYFDAYLDSEIWLKAQVVKGDAPVVEFFVDSPASWSQLQVKRAENHFLLYELDYLYSAHSASELRSIQGLLADAYADGEKDVRGGGKVALETELYKQWRSRVGAHSNSWQAAFYGALMASTWFTTKGWRRIGGSGQNVAVVA